MIFAHTKVVCRNKGGDALWPKEYSFFKLLILLVSVVFSAAAFGHLYVADVDEAEWNLDVSPLYCRLWQPVPAYGRGIFENRAGERQFFKLESLKKVHKKAVAHLSIVPPEWRSHERTRAIGNASTVTGLTPLQLAEPKPSQLLAFLEAGYFPQVAHPGWYPGHQIEVQISSVNFTAAYQEYLGCLGGLYPANFEQLERTTILFETDKFELDPAYFERLKLIEGYLKVDPQVVKVVIDGHTDSIGSDGHNWELSRNRAEVVSAYLQKIGLPKAQLEIRFHGERFPVAKNIGSVERARNRRTTLRLDRGDS